MRVAVDFSDAELNEICRFTGEAKAGPAIRKLILDVLMLRRRELIAQKFITGEWGVELAGYEAE
jgi:hypothetical protein